MTRLQSTTRPNEVGDTLRHLRERSGLSTRELARRTRVTASYVSKMELGQLGPKREFCRRVARVLGLSRAERGLLDALVTLHETEHRSVPSRGDALREAQEAVRKIERSCQTFRGFQLSLVPGLLQTRNYAEAVLSRLTHRSRIAVSVHERLARQEILEDSTRSVQFLISDWALGPHWCSKTAMASQLKHMQRLSRRPNIDIHVLPRDFEFPKDAPPLVTGFEILDDAVVIVDTLRGFTTFRQQEDVNAYMEAFNEVFPLGAPLSGSDRREAA